MTDIDRLNTIVDSLLSEMTTENPHDHIDVNCGVCQKRNMLLQTEARNICNQCVMATIHNGVLDTEIFMHCLVIGMEIGIAFEQSKQMEEIR
jgi:hypothetical protein